MHKKPKAFVALSGGVDSSVAAALLVRSGRFDVVGVYMKCWSDKIPNSGCTSEQDAEDARLVAEKLNIPFYVFEFEKEYREKVFDYMVRGYSRGLTPNPDVMCNKEIKFGVFLDKALELGADYIATGHYARKYEIRSQKSEVNSKIKFLDKFQIQNSKFKILAAKDKNKDQTYFLWTLTQEQLKHLLFPIGDYTKQEVRAMAKKFELHTHAKKDSQGLCFVGEIDFGNFLREILSRREGVIVSTSGKIIGHHDGVEFYTIGQRRGIGIGGGIPYYVAEKNIKTNTLVVAEGPYDEKLFKKELIATDVNWISRVSPALPLRCKARIRYRQPLQSCVVERISMSNKLIGANHESVKPAEISKTSSSNSCSVRVRFEESQRAVTTGQSVVFYRDNEMLGGGIIEI